MWKQDLRGLLTEKCGARCLDDAEDLENVVEVLNDFFQSSNGMETLLRSCEGVETIVELVTGKKVSGRLEVSKKYPTLFLMKSMNGMDRCYFASHTVVCITPWKDVE